MADAGSTPGKDLSGALDGMKSAAKRVPKYCNEIHAAKQGNSGFVLTFVAREKIHGDDGKSYDARTVIERVFVDEKCTDALLAELARAKGEKV